MFSDSISQLLNDNQNTLNSIADLNNVIVYNSATVANQIGAITLQLTNARLNNDKIQKLLDATLSTDPRAIVAQPSLITLFLGYLDKLNNLTAVKKLVLHTSNLPPVRFHSNCQQSDR